MNQFKCSRKQTASRFKALQSFLKAQKRVQERERLLDRLEIEMTYAQERVQRAIRELEEARTELSRLQSEHDAFENELELARKLVLTSLNPVRDEDVASPDEEKPEERSSAAADPASGENLSSVAQTTDGQELMECWTDDDEALLNEKSSVWMSEYKDKIRERSQLIEKNLKLVHYIVNKYYISKISGIRLSVEDLVQEGYLGLIKAAAKYDPLRGNFTTYAYGWVWQSIERAICDQGYLIRVPVHQHDDLRKLEKVRASLIQKMGVVPTLEELSEEMDMSKENVEKLLQYIQTDGTYVDLYDSKETSSDEEPPMVAPMNTRSLTQVCEDEIYAEDEKGVDQFAYSTMDLQAFSPDNDVYLCEEVEDENISSPCDELISSELSEQTHQLFEKLTPKEIDILNRRFGLNGYEEQTLEEIGQAYDLTRERIRQIETKAICKLRHPANASLLKPYYEDE